MVKSTKKQSAKTKKTGDWMILCKCKDKKKNDVYLPVNDRLHHQYFVWQDDTWKTTMILNQAIEDIKAWNGFCFIDQYGDYAEEILKYFPKERMDDLVYMDFSNQEYPIWINILNEARNTEEKDIITNHIIDMFLDMYGPELFGPRIQDYLHNACFLLMDQPEWWTIVDIMRLFTDDYFAEAKIKNIKDPVIAAWWNKTYRKIWDREKSEIIPFIQAKFWPFTRSIYVRNIIGQPESSVNFSEIVKENKIIICNLARWIIWNLNAEILWRILMMEMNVVLSRRIRMKKLSIKPYFLYLDGFQDYVWSSFGSFLLNASRNKLWVIMFNDYVTQLQKLWRDWVLDLSNFIFNLVGTVGSFRIWSLDAENLEKFFSPYFTKLDLQELKNNSLIIKKYENDSFVKPFLWYIKKNSEKIKNSPKKIDIIKEISSLKWWCKREIVDKEIYFRVGV